MVRGPGRVRNPPLHEGRDACEPPDHPDTIAPVDGARWIAVRARGGKARYSGDNYTFAHTGPVYFTDAPPNDASRASADFLAEVIEAIWQRVDQRDAWLRPEDREVYRRHLDEALARLAAN